MHNIVRTRVHCGAKLIEFINCTTGVKQGDACSSVLFSFVIDELAIEVINNDKHGASLPLHFVALLNCFTSGCCRFGCCADNRVSPIPNSILKTRFAYMERHGTQIQNRKLACMFSILHLYAMSCMFSILYLYAVSVLPCAPNEF